MAAMPTSPDVTVLLQRWQAGQPDAEEPLWRALWDELHRIARAHMGHQPSTHTLQPTALVSEAWLRLAPAGDQGFVDREHFLAFASRVMRSVLIDHARRRQAAKRGGDRPDRRREDLDGLRVTWVGLDDDRALDILALDEALQALQTEDAELVRVVELQFFGGLSMKESALVLGVSLSTAERRWRVARMWLRERLGNDGDDVEGGGDGGRGAGGGSGDGPR